MCAETITGDAEKLERVLSRFEITGCTHARWQILGIFRDRAIVLL